MAYADFQDYQYVYYGNAIKQASDFGRLAERASEYIDFRTFNRLRENADLVTDDVVKCVCALAELQYGYEQANSTENSDMLKTSEKVGEYSVTYAAPTDRNGHVLTLDDKKLLLIKQYLGHTGLLYRGW